MAPAKQPLTINIKPVTSETDVPDLTLINELALEGDPLKQWMKLFTEHTEWDSTYQAVTEALTDPNYHLMKAVIPDPEYQGKEKIVGFVHWMCGYIHIGGGVGASQSNLKKDAEGAKLPKDIKAPESKLTDELVEQAETLQKTPSKTREDEIRARRLEKGAAKYVETRNHYIVAIRGKKHSFIRRLMVLPEYQGMGIGRKLLDAVTSDADRKKIVSWLFARPAGETLYKRAGFESLGVTDMNEPEEGFDCPPTTSMMRLPQPIH